jgi:hypothetical protein
VVVGHAGCPCGRPWAVIEVDTDELVGCHASRAEAETQIAALEELEEEDESDRELNVLAAGLVALTASVEGMMIRPVWTQREPSTGSAPPPKGRHAATKASVSVVVLRLVSFAPEVPDSCRTVMNTTKCRYVPTGTVNTRYYRISACNNA